MKIRRFCHTICQGTRGTEAANRLRGCSDAEAWVELGSGGEGKGEG
ncbi:predicted protein [Plenodomus lingam JN3]|uniref:Predicted protein n=1 Tax=Leptosphaeria maculans (strain JN3 / isolate v23.1.3 / race Av1-4-5-6-7-8) TaxID=985895 RepID=E4ZIH6_LEPMJ|nr:predicted protein [Plenodomus lingam JN3]CBX90997.1 predicted protein [Plenodomus lingam JN3]